MKLVRTVAELRRLLEPLRRGSEIGLVPTMGAFHDGHLSLFRRARDECDAVVASLFVNPAQFARGEDLAQYPRDEARDSELAAAAGVVFLFAPPVEELYPPGYGTWVEVERHASLLEGAHRPGHFRGVATVCLKLFTIVNPQRAYFGQKDAQQAAVVAQLIRDLHLELALRVLPTVRDPDGVPLSSRNAYLSPGERERALALNRGLRAAEAVVAAGELEAERVVAAARAELDAAGVQPDYVELRCAEDLSPAARVNGASLLCVAARVGRARLIDNVVLARGENPPGTPPSNFTRRGGR